jgi:hypothetical protein
MIPNRYIPSLEIYIKSVSGGHLATMKMAKRSAYRSFRAVSSAGLSLQKKVQHVVQAITHTTYFFAGVRRGDLPELLANGNGMLNS